VQQSIHLYQPAMFYPPHTTARTLKLISISLLALICVQCNLITNIYHQEMAGNIFVLIASANRILLPAWGPPGTSVARAAEILGDPYTKKSPLPSIGDFPCLVDSPKLSSYRVLGQSRIQQRHTTRYYHPRIDTKEAHDSRESLYTVSLVEVS
jgi:hypothetical protein